MTSTATTAPRPKTSKLPTPLARLGWVIAVPAVVVAAVLAWTNMREPASFETKVMQVMSEKNTVCVQKELGADEGLCGWLVSRHVDQITRGSLVTVTIHDVKGIDGPVLEVEPSH